MAGSISQTSGTLSLSTIQTVMEGANPISMSEYYRAGAYVPTTKTVATASSYYSTANGSYQWMVQTGDYYYILFNYVVIFNGFIPGGTISYTTGGVTYERGSLIYHQEGYTGGGYGQPSTFYTIDEYYLRQITYANASINTSVPASGPISISNFYQTEKP